MIFWFDICGWLDLCCQFFPLAFLTWYFVCWGSALVTVGHAILPYVVRSRQRWKQFMCIPIYRDSPRIKIFWFDLCGWLAIYCHFFLLHFWLGILSVEGLHLWLLDVMVYLTLFGLDTVENNWGVDWIYRDLPVKMVFCFDLCVWLSTILGKFPHWRLEVLIQD